MVAGAGILPVDGDWVRAYRRARGMPEDAPPCVGCRWYTKSPHRNGSYDCGHRAALISDSVWGRVYHYARSMREATHPVSVLLAPCGPAGRFWEARDAGS